MSSLSTSPCQPTWSTSDCGATGDMFDPRCYSPADAQDERLRPHEHGTAVMSAAKGGSQAWERVDPPLRPVVFINPRSGDGKAARAALADRARERDIEPVVVGPGDDLAALI